MSEYIPNEMMRPAFDVGDLSSDFDMSVPPCNAQEYLQRVIHEATTCDQIVVADIDSTKLKPQVYLDVLPGCKVAPEELIPSKEWQQCQVADFAALRNGLIQKIKLKNKVIEIRLPGQRDEKGWRKLCIGSDELNTGKFETTPPLLSILLNPNMTQNVLLRVLEYNVEWLQEGFSENQGKWLFALLACLEMPLYPETCSLLRVLARECARIRADLNSPTHKFVAPLNLLICLVSKYYRQLDLAD